MNREIIKAEYKDYQIVADILPSNTKPQTICMHGAGTSSRKTYDLIREELLKNGVSSLAIDFLGHGETGGKVTDSSLKSRTEQAEAIIEKSEAIKPLNIIAGSMAAYNAIKLTEIYPVSLLVLFVPAVYRKDAYEVQFRDQFSALIRESKSWENTDAWGILNKYKGKILVIAAGKDESVPLELVQKVYNSASNAFSRDLFIFPKAPHRITSTYLKDHREDLDKIINKIVTLLK